MKDIAQDTGKQEMLWILDVDLGDYRPPGTGDKPLRLYDCGTISIYAANNRDIRVLHAIYHTINGKVELAEEPEWDDENLLFHKISETIDYFKKSLNILYFPGELTQYGTDSAWNLLPEEYHMPEGEEIPTIRIPEIVRLKLLDNAIIRFFGGNLFLVNRNSSFAYVITRKGKKVDYGAVVRAMDKKLLAGLRDEGLCCQQELFDVYQGEHKRFFARPFYLPTRLLFSTGRYPAEAILAGYEHLFNEQFYFCGGVTATRKVMPGIASSTPVWVIWRRGNPQQYAVGVDLAKVLTDFLAAHAVTGSERNVEKMLRQGGCSLVRQEEYTYHVEKFIARFPGMEVLEAAGWLDRFLDSFEYLAKEKLHVTHMPGRCPGRPYRDGHAAAISRSHFRVIPPKEFHRGKELCARLSEWLIQTVRCGGIQVAPYLQRSLDKVCMEIYKLSQLCELETLLTEPGERDMPGWVNRLQQDYVDDYWERLYETSSDHFPILNQLGRYWMYRLRKFAPAFRLAYAGTFRDTVGWEPESTQEEQDWFWVFGQEKIKSRETRNRLVNFNPREPAEFIRSFARDMVLEFADPAYDENRIAWYTEQMVPLLNKLYLLGCQCGQKAGKKMIDDFVDERRSAGAINGPTAL